MLKITDLHKSFFHRPIFKGLSLTINSGEAVCLLGKNGVGKSTLLRMISGLSSIDHGRITLQGNNITSGNGAARKDLLYLGHAPGLYPPFSAIENLSLAMELYAQPVDRELVYSILEKVGLTAQQDEPIKVYSQGMLQRLKLALALVLPWTILLFDEPYSGLDAQGRQLTETIMKDWKQKAKTMLLVVHDLEWALSFCSRVILLGKGEVLLDIDSIPTNLTQIRQTYEEAMI